MTTAAPAGTLALSLDDLPGPAFVLDGPEGRVHGHNAAFAAWAGRADVEGLALAELVPEDPGAIRLVQEARAAGAAERHLARRGPGGERSSWLLSARRTPHGVLVCATDLTAEAGAAQAALASARDYVAVAAHELRAPLSAIKAWAGALDARVSAPATGEGLGAISRQVDRMNDLLTDLLDAARAGSGRIRAERTLVSVEALVRGLPVAARIAILGDLPGQVFVDTMHVEALFLRLAGWIAARQPGLPVALRAAVSGAEVHLTVTDLGAPLSRRAEADLFGPSPRAGRGLGLYLCQHLAAANAGRLWREPALAGDPAGPAGSRFCLALPTPAPSGPRRGFAPARVLVADADAPGRARTVAALRIEGHEVSGVASMTTLLRELGAEGRWDVVIVDGTLLGAAASTAIREMRAAAGPPAILIVSPTAERPAILDGAERAGATAVLAHPIDWGHLISLVACAATSR